MSNKNIEMSKLRQIIKLYASHHQGTRSIRDATGISRTTIQKYTVQYRALRIPWDELSKLSDKDLYDLFHTDIVIPDPPEREKELYAFFPQVEKRIKQPGMTLNMLWKEYAEKECINSSQLIEKLLKEHLEKIKFKGGKNGK